MKRVQFEAVTELQFSYNQIEPSILNTATLNRVMAMHVNICFINYVARLLVVRIHTALDHS